MPWRGMVCRVCLVVLIWVSQSGAWVRVTGNMVVNQPTVRDRSVVSKRSSRPCPSRSIRWVWWPVQVCRTRVRADRRRSLIWVR